MHIKAASLFVWVPRTSLHVREFEKFLRFGETDLSFNHKKLDALHNDIGLYENSYSSSELEGISATLHDASLRMAHDGLLMLAQEKPKNAEGIVVENIYDSQVRPSLSYIYSKGAPVPHMEEDFFNNHPTIIEVEKANEESIQSVFSQREDVIIEIIPFGRSKAYVGADTIVVAGKKASAVDVVESLGFWKEFENYQHVLLHMHRLLWDEIAKVREKQRVRYRDLPEMRDELVDLEKDISFFRARLQQMAHFIPSRKDRAPGELRDRFDRLEVNQRYLYDLWVMTEEYSQSTLQLVGMLYQENEQREISSLQIIFIVGVVTSLLSLGTISGAFIEVENTSGETIATGQLASFAVSDLLIYGVIALALSTAVYFVVHYIFTSLKQFRVVDIAGVRNGKIQAIRHSWKKS